MVALKDLKEQEAKLKQEIITSKAILEKQKDTASQRVLQGLIKKYREQINDVQAVLVDIVLAQKEGSDERIKADEEVADYIGGVETDYTERLEKRIKTLEELARDSKEELEKHQRSIGENRAEIKLFTPYRCRENLLIIVVNTEQIIDNNINF